MQIQSFQLFIVQIVVILLMVEESTTKPFLFSTSKWIWQKLVNSSSSQDHSTTNIEDLYEEGSAFHHNMNKTQVTDLTVTAIKKPTSESLISDYEEVINKKENETLTDETPGILHRKISKILNKLQLYSAVRSTIHNVRKQQAEGSNITMKNIPKPTENSTVLSPNMENSTNLTMSSTLPNSNFTQLTYLPPSNDTMDDFDFNEENVGDEFNEKIDAPFVFDEDLKDSFGSNSNKLSLETGNLGIHIMEIFGSIVTVLLTAAYQVGNYASSLTQGQSSGQITSKPIEGTGVTIAIKV